MPQLQEAFLHFLSSSPSPPTPEVTESTLLQGVWWQKELFSVQACPQRALCILVLLASPLGWGEGEDGPQGKPMVPLGSEDREDRVTGLRFL